MPWDPPGGAGESVRGEGSLGVPAQAAAPATRPWISRRKWMDGWMEHEIIIKYNNIGVMQEGLTLFSYLVYNILLFTLCQMMVNCCRFRAVWARFSSTQRRGLNYECSFNCFSVFIFSC